MEKHLCPPVFNCDPSSAMARKEWNHWLTKFTNFITVAKVDDDNKLKYIINFVGPTIYELVSSAPDYTTAMGILKTLFEKPPNEIFARHQLAIRRQQPVESIDQYVQTLQSLAKDCNYKTVTAEIYQNEAIRDAFIAGLLSPNIRQRQL